MTGLIEDYLREVEAGLRIEPPRRRQVVDELRSHLNEKVEDLRRREPHLPLADVERDVLRDMGSPRDLALAYEPDGLPVLVNRAGETVLRVGKAVGRGAAGAARAVGRGTGRLLKGVAIALGVLLLVALVAGAWAYYELKPYALAVAEDSRPLYAYTQTCYDAPCDVAGETQAFYVKPEARHVRLLLDLGPLHQGRNHTGSGNVSVTLADPSGLVLYERALVVSSPTDLYQELQWAATPGNWTMTVEATDFVGHLNVRTYASSGPWDALAGIDEW